MTQVVQRRPRPLGVEARRLLALTLVYQQEHDGAGPPFRLLWQRCGVPAPRGWRKLEQLRQRRYITWRDEIPNSLAVTASGAQAARTGLHGARQIADKRGTAPRYSECVAQSDNVDEIPTREEVAEVATTTTQAQQLERKWLAAVRKQVRGTTTEQGAKYDRLKRKDGRTLAYYLAARSLSLHIPQSGGPELRLLVQDDKGLAAAVKATVERALS